MLGATYECKVQSNGTGPASRRLQDKVGGVTPAGLSLLIERRVAALVISVHCHSRLQRVRHEKHRRFPTAGLAKEPARVQCPGCGYGRKPGSIQHGRFCPHPAGLRSRQVRQELGATTSLGLSENLDAGITQESHHHVVVDVLAIKENELRATKSGLDDCLFLQYP